MPSRREIAAHHEAGHAVVALACRATGLRASIRPHRNSAGRVLHDDLPAQAHLLLYITLAGPFAHRRYAPRSNWLTSDFNVVCDMIFGKGSRDDAAKQKYLAYIVEHAEGIVDFFWADIEVAAKALLKYETVIGGEISAAIRAARRKSRRRRRVGDPPAFALTK
jgi:hypothetical protein